MYGVPPEIIREIKLDLEEFMHYQYLPVYIPFKISVPQNLQSFIPPLIREINKREKFWSSGMANTHYIYVTAKHRFATPESPLNRPGWHCDGFGTDDINYIWFDKFSTRFAIQDFTDISPDHVESMKNFDEQIEPDKIVEYQPNTLLRLTPYVVHTTPDIPAPGDFRSFIKISISRNKYNLAGNSHNYGLNYDWKMWPREIVRNHPIYAESDFYVE